MALEKKPGITDIAELARAEERISKKKTLELFERNILDTFEAGTFMGLCEIHKICLMKYMILQGSCRQLTLHRSGFGLPI